MKWKNTPLGALAEQLRWRSVTLDEFKEAAREMDAEDKVRHLLEFGESIVAAITHSYEKIDHPITQKNASIVLANYETLIVRWALEWLVANDKIQKDPEKTVYSVWRIEGVEYLRPHITFQNAKPSNGRMGGMSSCLGVEMLNGAPDSLIERWKAYNPKLEITDARSYEGEEEDEET